MRRDRLAKENRGRFCVLRPYSVRARNGFWDCVAYPCFDRALVK